MNYIIYGSTKIHRLYPFCITRALIAFVSSLTRARACVCVCVFAGVMVSCYRLCCLGPYLAKTKTPLMEVLNILQQVAVDVRQNPTSFERERGDPERITKHILERTINRLNLKMELSDYQVVAGLLDVPSTICSEQFSFGNPRADNTYRQLLERERSGTKEDRGNDNGRSEESSSNKASDDDAESTAREDGNKLDSTDSTISGENEIVSIWEKTLQQIRNRKGTKATGNSTGATVAGSMKEEIFYGLGRLRKFSWEEIVSANKTIKHEEFIPWPILYENRGSDLHVLNRHEMRALIQIEKKDKSVTKRQCDFRPQFLLSAAFTQVPHRRHKTPILTSKPPPHPGNEPSKELGNSHAQWKSKADKYAEYYLSEFRPQAFGEKQDFDWDALCAFVTKLETDSSIISKFRLMSMHMRMKGLSTTTAEKLMVSEHRARARHMWTPQERRMQEIVDWHERNAVRRAHEEMDDHDFSMKFPRLDAQSKASAEDQINFTNIQRKSLAQISGGAAARRRFENDSTPFNIKCNRSLFAAGQHSNFGTVRSIVERAQDVKQHSKKADDGGDDMDVCRMGETSERYNNKHYEVGKLKEQLDGLESVLKGEQVKFFRVFRRCIENPCDEKCRPPSLTLLHGMAGTGKSTLMKQIMRAVSCAGFKTFTSAFNHMNTLPIRGWTTGRTFGLKADVHSKQFVKLNSKKLTDLANELSGVMLIIIDEVSHQAPFHLSQVAWAIAQAKRQNDEDHLPFGGIPVILAGDLNQIGPVKAGADLTMGLMLYLEAQFDFSRAQSRARNKSKRSKKKTTGPNIDFLPPPDLKFTSKWCQGHPFLEGVRLFQKAKWFELHEQRRSVDPVHTARIKQLYERKDIGLDLFYGLKFLSNKDFEGDDAWFDASYIVSTNRERLTLIPHLAQRFAKHVGAVVYRWKADYKQWKAKPLGIYEELCQEDPCFYEYMVAGADGYIVDNQINVDLGLVNALPIKYHSLVLDDSEKGIVDELLASAEPGDMMTLGSTPLAINIVVDGDLLPEEKKKKLIHFSISDADDEIVIPILPGGTELRKDVPIPGGDGYGVSRVGIKPHFRLELVRIHIDKHGGWTKSATYSHCEF